MKPNKFAGDFQDTFNTGIMENEKIQAALNC